MKVLCSNQAPGSISFQTSIYFPVLVYNSIVYIYVWLSQIAFPTTGLSEINLMLSTSVS